MKSKLSNNICSKNDDQIRLDIWLWTSRFYKSRKLASDAVKGGHVLVNEKKTKPGRTVKINDSLVIKKYPQRYLITILGLSEKRLSAPLAQMLYEESEESRRAREASLEMRKQLHQGIRYDPGKPSKRDRRRMLSVKRRVNES